MSRPVPSIDPDQLADALLAGEPEVEAAAAAVVTTLSAWRSFPPFVRRAFGRQARRMATRAATALAKLLEVAGDRRATSNTSRRGAAGEPCDERIEP